MSNKPNKLVVEGKLSYYHWECLWIDDEKALPELVEAAFDMTSEGVLENQFCNVRITIERLEDV